MDKDELLYVLEILLKMDGNLVYVLDNIHISLPNEKILSIIINKC